MSLNDKLAIYLVTYNRKKHLENTLNAIFSETSPIKNFEITILDNASTDGTTELIQKYSIKHPNIKHIRHNINIGGDANIIRAYELGASNNKEYIWVLCDDDKYDFTNWNEVEKEINNKTDIICCANYCFFNNRQFNDKAYQLLQLTFVPAGIYRKELFTSSVLINFYNATFTMLSQACVSIYAMNLKKKIKVLENAIVDSGLHYDDCTNNRSYSRGCKQLQVLERRKNTTWILGYCNVISLFKNKKLAQKCLHIAIPHPEIEHSWKQFYRRIFKLYFNPQNFNYFIEIYSKINFFRKINFLLFILILIPLKQIFSIRNNKNKKHKILTILGIKINIKKKQKSNLTKKDIQHEKYSK